jgi:hypothetical protein
MVNRKVHIEMTTKHIGLTLRKTCQNQIRSHTMDGMIFGIQGEKTFLNFTKAIIEKVILLSGIT